jgi:hypothetical protein
MVSKILLLFILFPIILLSQPKYDAKRDYTWIFGHYYNSLDSIQHVYFNFHGDTMALKFTVDSGLQLWQTNGSVCDTAGNLLFYSNGCIVADSSHYKLLYSLLNPSSSHAICIDGGYNLLNALWVLPVEENLFHLYHIQLKTTPTIHYGDRLFRSIIHRDSVSGELSVLEYNNTLLSSALTLNMLSACRHGNGRDWWLIVPNISSNEYHILMVGKDGIHKSFLQTIGYNPEDDNLIESSSTQAVFTADGGKYISYDNWADIRIFDFDRCDGTLSNPLHIPIQDYADIFPITGIAASPNSRFLYVCSGVVAYQFDLNSSDIASTKQVIAVQDTFTDRGFVLAFNQCQLGPDGKIYISNAAGRSTFHVIEYPDSSGLACKFVQHKYYFPEHGTVGSGMPRFPNFRLGPLVGSPCDSLTVADYERPKAQHQVLVLPNPASREAMISVLGGVVYDTWVAYDVGGREVAAGEVTGAVTVLDVAGWDSGVYFVRLRRADGYVATRIASCFRFFMKKSREEC